MTDALIPWHFVRVSGPSMVPTLKDGDLLLVRVGAAAKPGDVVVARFRSMPDRLVVKRVRRLTDGGAELVSDNSFAGGDSATHGVADVLGRVILRRPAGTLRILRLRG
jgi:phage repressor protein C with HTH and peptisase S24 domain